MKEICEKDPLNATYVTIYIQLLVQSKQQQGTGGETAGAGASGGNSNPEYGGGSAEQGEAIAEARKIFESSLRYNASQVDLWESYLTFLQHNHAALGEDADEQIKQVFERAI